MGGYASGGKRGKFSNLEDTFEYSGLGGKFVKVKVDESGLETGTGDIGGGDVSGPATNTADYIPQWNGANSKLLKDGLSVPAGGLAGLTELGDKVDKVAGKNLSENDLTDVLKIAYDAAASNSHAQHSDDQDLSGKVDKVSGSSLVPDTEILKIHSLHADDQDLSLYVTQQQIEGLR